MGLWWIYSETEFTSSASIMWHQGRRSKIQQLWRLSEHYGQSEENQLRCVPSTQDKSVTHLLSRVFIYVFSAYTSSKQRELVVSGCTLWQAVLSWQRASCFIIAHRGNTSTEGADRLPSWKHCVWCVGDVLAEENCSNCGPIVVLSNRGF